MTPKASSEPEKKPEGKRAQVEQRHVASKQDVDILADKLTNQYMNWVGVRTRWTPEWLMNLDSGAPSVPKEFRTFKGKESFVLGRVAKAG